MRKQFWVVGFLFLSIWNQRAQAYIDLGEALRLNQVVLISDYDNTLTGPAWKTMWQLQKVSSLQSFFQLSGMQSQLPEGQSFETLPRTIAISESEFLDTFYKHLAVQEASGKMTPRSAKAFILPTIPFIFERQVPQLFLPGLYKISDVTWERFRAQPLDKSYLIEDDAIAQRLEKEGYGSRFGLSYPLFRMLLSSRKSVDNVHIPTARGQTEDEFQQLFASWQKQRLIRYLQGNLSTADRRITEDGRINVYPLGNGEGLLYGEGITQRKVQLARDQIIPHYLLLGQQKQVKYVVVIAENDPLTLRAYEQMLKEISGIPLYQKHLEFVLLHAGSEADLALSGLPGRWTRVSNQPLTSLTLAEETLLSQAPRRVIFSSQRRTGAKRCRDIFSEVIP